MGRRYGTNPKFEPDQKLVQPLYTMKGLNLNPLRVTANNGYEYSVKFINHSRHNITIVTQDGMVMQSPARYDTVGNMCYFATKYVIGCDVTIPWRSIQENEVLDDQQAQSIQAAFDTYRQNHGFGAAVEVEFRYEIDVTDLALIPHGIYIPMTGAHLHLCDHLSNPSELVNYGRSRYADRISINTEDANESGGVLDATVRVVAYVVNDINEKRPVIMTGQFGTQVLQPVHDWARPEGIHIVHDGNWSDTNNRTQPIFEFIPRESFRERGVFVDISELRVHLAKMAKKAEKEPLEEILSQLDALLGNKQKPPPEKDNKSTQWDKLLQIKLFESDLTLDHVLQGLEIANKIKDLVGKLAKV